MKYLIQLQSGALVAAIANTPRRHMCAVPTGNRNNKKQSLPANASARNNSAKYVFTNE